MNGADNISIVLEKLQLSDSNTDWIDNLWLCGFMEQQSHSSFEEELYDSDFYCEILLEALNLLNYWVSRNNDTTERGFWKIFIDSNLSQKNLVALLFGLMDIGVKKSGCVKYLAAAINAASIYTILLQIKGSGAFKVFQPAVMEKVFECFKLVDLLQGNVQQSSKRKAATKTGNTKKKRANRKQVERDSDEENLWEDDIEGTCHNEDHASEALSVTDMATLHQHLKSLLRNIIGLLKTPLLKTTELTEYSCLQLLIRLTRFEPETNQCTFVETEDISNITTLPDLACKGLLVLSSSHSCKTSMINNIFKHLLPDILMISDEKVAGAQTIPRHVIALKENAVKFVSCVIKLYGDEILSCVRTLLQHICVKTVDKAEYRQKTGQAVVMLLKDMSANHYSSFMEWFEKFSRHSKAGCRVFALQVIAELLSQPEHDLTYENHNDSDSPMPGSHAHLVNVILPRCSDVVGSVRAEALVALNACIVSEIPSVCAVAKQLFVTEDSRTTEYRMTDDSLLMDVVSHNSKSVNTKSSSSVTRITSELKTVHITNDKEVSLGDVNGTLSMLRTRAMDEKVNVRKASLHLLEEVIRINSAVGQNEELEAIHAQCWDVAVSARKQAIQSLSALLQDFPSNGLLQKLWVDGAFEMITDRETSVQEKCLELIWQIVMANVKTYDKRNDGLAATAWDILATISKPEAAKLRNLLHKACGHWQKQGLLKSSLIGQLKSFVNTEHNSAMWTLLAAVGPYCSKFDVAFIIDYWLGAVSSADSEWVVLSEVLILVQRISTFFKADQSDALSNNLKDKLIALDLPVELIAEALRTLKKLDTVSPNGMDEWLSSMLKENEKYLSAYVCSREKENLSEEKTVRNLFTLGELVHLCPSRISKRHHLLAQSYVAAPAISSQDWSSQPNQLLSSQPTLSQDVLSQFRDCSMPGRIRAHAFLTLGKMCLHSEELAKKCVPAFARELEVCNDFIIRNNVMMIMGDLAIRYGTLMDCYFSCIACCLRDESELIRKQTLGLLSRLLKEDFMKWKGSLYYRFITTLVDEAKDIQTLAEYVLTNLFMQRYPMMFYQHFVESIFHFNAYENHPVFNKFHQTEREKKLFALNGKQNAGKRMKIYSFLLDNMTDEHKFKLTTKICQEILAAVVDEVLPLTDETCDLLKDAFYVLASKEIKLSSLKVKSTEDAETEQEMAAVVMNAAKKTVITQVVKTNVIENIVPVIMSLKTILERNRSPVLRDLMLFLQELVKDYKAEIQEIFAADRQLAKEVEFDLRRFEEQQLRERQQIIEKAERERRMSALQFRDGVCNSPVNLRRSIAPLVVSENNSPLVQQGSVGIATPIRNVPVSRAAIMNSAQRTVEEMVKTSRRKSLVAADHVVTWADKDRYSSSSHGSPALTPSTYRANFEKSSRAISTPSYNLPLSSLTFRGDETNISIIPQNRSLSRTGSSSTINESQENSAKSDKLVFRPPPATPTWNIRANTSIQDTSNIVDTAVHKEDDMDVPNANENFKPKRTSAKNSHPQYLKDQLSYVETASSKRIQDKSIAKIDEVSSKTANINASNNESSKKKKGVKQTVLGKNSDVNVATRRSTRTHSSQGINS